LSSTLFIIIKSVELIEPSAFKSPYNVVAPADIMLTTMVAAITVSSNSSPFFSFVLLPYIFILILSLSLKP